MSRMLISIAAATMALGVGGGAQPPAALTFHDLSTMQRWPFARMQARGAMGQSSSIVLEDVPPGLRTTPHHHHQEQVMLGLGGNMKYLMAGTPYPLENFTAALALPNVQHGNLNDTDQPAQVLEYQAMPRPDWFPPHPRVERQGAPAAVPIPEGRTVTESFAVNSTGWTTEKSGARSKLLTGDTVRLTIWSLPAGTEPVDVARSPVERFLYVVSGKASIRDGSGERAIGHQMLVLASASAKGVLLRTPKDGGATIAVFEPLVR